ncbi:MAG: FimB/Mfa2 family fimbrial subunit [Bacteroides sp.]|nr:FimB/Mfa2 family fimbrial subunit [Bacteroides sp.]
MKSKDIHSKNSQHTQGIPLLVCLLFTLFISCTKDDANKGKEGDDAVISLSVSSASYSINQDEILWEDRVDELRMLVFRTDNGEIVFNQKLYFPDGFSQKSKAVRLPLGTFDFYFIANETVYPDDFVSALTDIENESQFRTDTRFTTLAYHTGFTPDGTTPAGRFVMSAVYTNITVTGGGTESNPALLNIPNGRVELIRALAKIEVVFRKKVSGGEVPDQTITSVLLEDVASRLSVPPLDDYYTGPVTDTPEGSLSGLDYNRDSIGSVVFYIPEFLVAEGSTTYTLLEINNQTFPIQTDDSKIGITEQRRTVPALSNNSVIRNYHYLINVYLDSEGGLQIITYVEPWIKDAYRYIFQGDQQITIPPVEPTDSSVIIPTDCGKIEILSHNEYLTQGLQGAYNDVVNYYDPELQGPTIYRGDPPYYCEKKYGPGWRLINSCELLSFLALLDELYNIYLSNTWLAADHPEIPYYPLRFRQEAGEVLEKLTGVDLSQSVLYPTNNWKDEIENTKLDIIDDYFTPGDIMLREMDFPNGWPFASPPGTSPSEDWYYNEVVIQVKAFWYTSGYLSPSDRDNWDTILYHEFRRYDYSSTVSRCVRAVER